MLACLDVVAIEPIVGAEPHTTASVFQQHARKGVVVRTVGSKDIGPAPDRQIEATQPYCSRNIDATAVARHHNFVQIIVGYRVHLAVETGSGQLSVVLDAVVLDIEAGQSLSHRGKPKVSFGVGRDAKNARSLTHFKVYGVIGGRTCCHPAAALLITSRPDAAQSVLRQAENGAGCGGIMTDETMVFVQQIKSITVGSHPDVPRFVAQDRSHAVVAYHVGP